MDVTTIRIIAGVLAVVVLFIIIWRRRGKADRVKHRRELMLLEGLLRTMIKLDQKRAVYVYNKTRETFVATEAIVADSYVRRLVGLLGKTERWAKTRNRTLDCSFPWRAHDRNAFSHRPNLSEQAKRGRASGRARSAISHLESFFEGQQRSRTSCSHNISLRHAGWRSI